MNNISQISKAPRLTEEEVHAAAEELQLNSGKVGSIEIYRYLGRGSLTTITNYLKTWRQEEKAAALPALIMLPEALMKSTEQLIVKVWAESQALAEQELKSQQEALRQAEALANKKIAEAEAFSEEQTVKIEALEAEIDELKKDFKESNKSWKKEVEETNEAYIKAFTKSEILEERTKEDKKQLKAAEEKINQLEALVTDSKKFVLEAEKLREKVAGQTNKTKYLEDAIYQEKQRVEGLAEENIRVHKDNRDLIEKAAKLEGELIAWKEIKPEDKKATTEKPIKEKLLKPVKKEAKQIKWPEEITQ